MKTLAIPLAALALAGCATGGMDADRSDAIRSIMHQQIAAWNAAGIDPLALAPQQLLYASLACGTLSSLSTVVDPTAASLAPALGAWCSTAVQAAAPAANIAPEVPAVPPES